LRILRNDQNFYATLEKKCRKLVNSFKGLSKDLSVHMQVNHVASMFQMFLTDKPVYDYASALKADSKGFLGFHKRLLGQGVFLPPSQFETCFLSSTHTEGDIERTVRSFGRALQSHGNAC
jgi:glutamate-1-semialdehyde 2,1-aminomutase